MFCIPFAIQFEALKKKGKGVALRRYLLLFSVEGRSELDSFCFVLFFAGLLNVCIPFAIQFEALKK
jgi:hypothetical protein